MSLNKYESIQKDTNFLNLHLVNQKGEINIEKS